MNKIVAIARFAAVFVFVVCCLFIIAFVLPMQGPQAKGRLIRRWAARLLRWLGVKLVIKGEQLPRDVHDSGVTPGELGRLLVSNHVSFLDIFALNAVFPSGFVAKAEIAHWPIFGLIARSVGTIFIERGNKRALIGIGDSMRAALQDGRNLLMFPEGTTSDGTKLLKLHANLMECAVKMQANVVPVVLRYRLDGEVTTIPAYVGDTGLFECLWNVVKTPGLSVEVAVLSPRKGLDRHELCRGISADMAEYMGVEDPMKPSSLSN